MHKLIIALAILLGVASVGAAQCPCQPRAKGPIRQILQNVRERLVDRGGHVERTVGEPYVPPAQAQATWVDGSRAWYVQPPVAVPQQMAGPANWTFGSVMSRCVGSNCPR